MKTFAKKLQAWRGKRAQPEAAAALSVPLRTYQNWEQGHRVPAALAAEALERRMAAAAIAEQAERIRYSKVGCKGGLMAEGAGLDSGKKRLRRKPAGQRPASSNPKSGSAAARAARPARRTGRKG